ncbi:MAG: molybdopterin synthase [Halobacteriales archaeon]|nr:molybdopterin synthase [Halobacteriales archaeon]
MHVLGIVGPSARATATELAELLSGRVAVVTAGEPVPSTDISTTTILGDRWQMTGDDAPTLDETLDRLARSHDYALVLGFPDAALPQFVLDGTTVSTPLFDDPVDDLDPQRVVDALHEFPEHESLESLVAAVKRSDDADRAGAVATFTGRVRRFDSPNDAATTRLEFEMYDEVAHARMDDIRTDLEAREGVFDVRLHHRQGVVPEGEDIVFVVVLAGHRKEAFAAVSDGIDRLKDEVPIFKREVTNEKTFWVETDG